MLEIVFSESACGALKLAQRYGEGRYRGGAIGVIARNEDGSEPSQEELDKLRREAEERERRAKEAAEAKARTKKIFTVVVCVILVLALGIPTMALTVLSL